MSYHFKFLWFNIPPPPSWWRVGENYMDYNIQVDNIWWWVFTLMAGENMVSSVYCGLTLPWWWVFTLMVGLFTLMVGVYLDGRTIYLDGWDYLPWWWEYLPWWWVRTWSERCDEVWQAEVVVGWVSRSWYRSVWPADTGTVGQEPSSSPMPRGG
jgi:hypothetical protein